MQTYKLSLFTLIFFLPIPSAQHETTHFPFGTQAYMLVINATSIISPSTSVGKTVDSHSSDPLNGQLAISFASLDFCVLSAGQDHPAGREAAQVEAKSAEKCNATEVIFLENNQYPPPPPSSILT